MLEHNKHQRPTFPMHPHDDAVLAEVPARRHDLVLERRVRGFRFTESRHQGFIAPHMHEHATVTVLLKGTFEETYGLVKRTCETNSVLLRPAGEPHADRIGQAGAHNFVLEIDKERACSISEYASILGEVVHLRDPRLITLVHRMRGELKAADEASHLSLEGLAMEFVALMIRANTAKQTTSPPWLRRGETMLRDRFRDEGIQIRDLAQEAGVHPVHFTRAFKMHYGTTPGDYLRMLRVEWAATQLQRPQVSIATIALEAGFVDQSHFSRVFKQHFGYSPAKWRSHHNAT